MTFRKSSASDVLPLVGFFGPAALTRNIVPRDTISNGGKRWTVRAYAFVEENLPNLASYHECYPHYLYTTSPSVSPPAMQVGTQLAPPLSEKKHVVLHLHCASVEKV